MQRVDRDLAVWGCEWAVRLYGPQAWMTHSTWTHRHVVRRKQLNLVRKENISFTSSQVQDSCCRITASTSHAYCTLARHLATNQLTDHLSPSQVKPSLPSPHPTANPFNAVIKVSLCILCSGRHGLPKSADLTLMYQQRSCVWLVLKYYKYWMIAWIIEQLAHVLFFINTFKLKTKTKKQSLSCLVSTIYVDNSTCERVWFKAITPIKPGIFSNEYISLW